MRFSVILSFITLIIVMLSCDKEASQLVDPSYEVSFQIQKIKDGDGFTSLVEDFEITNKSAGWRLNRDSTVQLTREIELDVKLANGDTLKFGFWFIKYEKDASLLILKDDQLYYGERRWDYISTETESIRFYQEFDEARILLNYNVIFHKKVNENFELISVEPALIDGKEQSYVTINFAGDAYGWYDPTGEFQGIYRISNGVFKGVIE